LQQRGAVPLEYRGAITKADATRANALIRKLADTSRATGLRSEKARARSTNWPQAGIFASARAVRPRDAHIVDLGFDHGYDFLQRAPLGGGV
jgi:hypothetical protein